LREEFEEEILDVNLEQQNPIAGGGFVQLESPDCEGARESGNAG
jgi:hypothetical protein